MKVVKRPVLVYTLEATEQEMDALERTLAATVRHLYGNNTTTEGSITSRILAEIRAARVGEGE